MPFPLLGLVPAAVKGVLGIVKEKVKDKDLELELTNKLAAMELDIQSQLLQLEGERIQAQASVLKAEARSEHMLTAIWRPILALLIGFTAVFSIWWNYILRPLLYPDLIPIDLPQDMWDLTKIFFSIYLFSRGGEKMIAKWKNGAK